RTYRPHCSPYSVEEGFGADLLLAVDPGGDQLALELADHVAVADEVKSGGGEGWQGGQDGGGDAAAQPGPGVAGAGEVDEALGGGGAGRGRHRRCREEVRRLAQ